MAAISRMNADEALPAFCHEQSRIRSRRKTENSNHAQAPSFVDFVPRLTLAAFSPEARIVECFDLVTESSGYLSMWI
jgi:hypothetical protein